VIKFVSDLRQFGSFCAVTPVSSNNKTDGYDITEILLNVALNTISQPSIYRGHHGHDRLVPVVGFIFMYLPYTCMQSAPITTNVLSSLAVCGWLGVLDTVLVLCDKVCE
jgi:hypothetical protein